MTSIERLEFIIYTEIDQYINTVHKNTTMNQDVRRYILDTVIPRFNTLRESIVEIKKELNGEYIPEEHKEHVVSLSEGARSQG